MNELQKENKKLQKFVFSKKMFIFAVKFFIV